MDMTLYLSLLDELHHTVVWCLGSVVLAFMLYRLPA